LIADAGLIFLCADDFALTQGISEGILSLAEAGQLSGTSAIVTTPHWRNQAKAVAGLRNQLALGLHLNLTFGRPLGPMPQLAPDGILPPPYTFIRRALTGNIDREEISSEIDRQLDRFISEMGFAPDFVDSHHHTHIFPGVREAFIDVLKQRFRRTKLLIRDPSDTPGRILRRYVGAAKALSVAMLTVGFRKLALANRFLLNVGFSGYSTFGTIAYAREFDSFLLDRGSRHMIMCHPGFADSELEGRDSKAERRLEEYAVLSTRSDISSIIWRPNRLRDGRCCWT